PPVQQSATQEGTFQLGIGEPAFGDLDIPGSAVPLDDGSAEGEEDPKESTPESPPVAVNTSVQDDTSTHPPPIDDLDPKAGEIGTKRRLEYHVQILDGTLSPV